MFHVGCFSRRKKLACNRTRSPPLKLLSPSCGRVTMIGWIPFCNLSPIGTHHSLYYRVETYFSKWKITKKNRFNLRFSGRPWLPSRGLFTEASPWLPSRSRLPREYKKKKFVQNLRTFSSFPHHKWPPILPIFFITQQHIYFLLNCIDCIWFMNAHIHFVIFPLVPRTQKNNSYKIFI